METMCGFSYTLDFLCTLFHIEIPEIPQITAKCMEKFYKSFVILEKGQQQRIMKEGRLSRLLEG